MMNTSSEVLGSERLRRRVLIYSAVMVLCIGAVVAAVSVIPLFNRLKETAIGDLLHVQGLQTGSVEQYLSRIANLARQVTSRTRIRQELARYNAGEISLEELRAFSAPKLEDAMRESEEMLGITRLDREKQVVVQVGEPVPDTAKGLVLACPQELAFSDPTPLGDALHIVVSAPICGKDGRIEGTDVVVFTTASLGRIIEDSRHLGLSGETLLAIERDGAVVSVFPRRLVADRDEVRFEPGPGAGMGQAISPPPGEPWIQRVTGRDGRTRIVAAGRLAQVDWVLAVDMAEEELIAPIKANITVICLWIALLVVVGTAGMFFLLRPLTGRILIHTRELNRQVGERTEALREESALVRNLLRSISSLAIAATDLDLRIRYFSPEAERLFGLGAEGVLGRRVNELQAHGRVDPARFATCLGELRAKGLYEFEFSVPAPGGLQREVAAQASSVVDDRGALKGYLLLARDVTQERRQARDKDRMAERLRQSQKMEAIGLMAGGVAHDLNNILSGIVSYPELLLVDMAPDNPMREPLETMQEAGRRAAAVVADLLTVARGIQCVKQVINLNDLIDRFLGSTEFHGLRKNFPHAQLETRLAPNLLNTRCSPVHLGKVLLNLVLNGLEAVGENGLVELRTDNRFIESEEARVGGLEAGEYVVLVVRDNGSGIREEDLKRIFEPFFTKKAMGREGTGLGLTVVWNTVLDHKGRVGVESGDQGTVFTILLPATREEPPPGRAEAAIDDLAGKGESVLVIDDQHEQRVIATKMLERLGYRVKMAAGGQEALRLARERKFDLLLLDMIMEPGMNGHETYEGILALRPGQKAVIVSGYSESAEVCAAQELGAATFVKKPYLLRELGLAVKRALAEG